MDVRCKYSYTTRRKETFHGVGNYKKIYEAKYSQINFIFLLKKYFKKLSLT